MEIDGDPKLFCFALVSIIGRFHAWSSGSPLPLPREKRQANKLETQRRELGIQSDEQKKIERISSLSKEMMMRRPSVRYVDVCCERPAAQRTGVWIRREEEREVGFSE